MRALSVVVVFLAVLTIGASSAFAATVSRAGGVITVAGTDADDEINVLYDAGDDTWVFEDVNDVNVDFAPDCMESNGDPNDVECQDEDVTRIVMNLGGGADGSAFDAQIPAPATVNGEGGDDCAALGLNGTAQGDEINGGAGVDCAQAGEGNDTIDGGEGNDFNLNGGNGNDNLLGGPGDDEMDGDADDDVLRGGPDDDDLDDSAGTDQFFGEDGDDLLTADELSADVYDGGEGLDHLDYGDYDPGEPVAVTLDGQANDGANAENDNALNVEDLTGGDDADSLRGSDASESSIMVGGDGNDTINPGTLEDVVSGNDGDDNLDTRDGFTDRVSCGSGNDTANVDSQDLVSAGCESLTIEPRANARDVPEIPEDAPPAVQFTAPTPGAAIASGAPFVLTANAQDDLGVARVLFMDDDRVVCTDETAPYTCDYASRGEDVGRNTLTAIAVDTLNQIGIDTRTIAVSRFVATRLSIRTRPRTDSSFPYRFVTRGRLVLPAAVTPALGCRGTVTVTVKAGGKTVSTRRARVSRTCSYRSVVTFGRRARLNPGRLTFRATFGGNAVVQRKVSRRVVARVRRG